MNWGYWGNVGVAASKAYQDRMARAGIDSIDPPEAMDALETLVGCAMNQMAFIKTLKPLPPKDYNAGEMIEVYPENIQSYIQKLDIPVRDPLNRGARTEENLPVKEMEDLLCRILLAQLDSMGLFAMENPPVGGLFGKSGLCASYERWLEESLSILVRNHYLDTDGSTFAKLPAATAEINAVWSEWEQKKGKWLKDPGMRPYVDLVGAVLPSLPRILTGDAAAADIMSPEASMELVEGIYKNNPVADRFNTVLADSVLGYIKERLRQEPSARIRILEIGAGTGAAGAMVIKRLTPYQEHIQEYCCTDISQTFLLHAEKEYGTQTPYLTFKIFNVEAPDAGQTIGAGGYDLVIAADALYANRNIRQALRIIKAGLKKNGLILLNEISCNTVFNHLTFGLLQWGGHYDDPELGIPGCPGLSSQTWRTVLENEGFGKVIFPAPDAHYLGRQIIVAESDGIVRRKLMPGAKAVEKNKTRAELMHGSRAGMPPDRGAAKTKTMPQSMHAPGQMIEAHIKETIIEKLSESLNLEAEIIDVDVSFADYGLDSILGVHLVQNINQALAIALEATDLFDYSTVNQMTAHILSRYKDIISVTAGPKGQMDLCNDPSVPHHEKERMNSDGNRSHDRRISAEGTREESVESPAAAMSKDAIAIVGMSGRFAKSRSVNELWQHLATGNDLVEKVSRWDLARYHSEQDYCNAGSFLGGIDQFDPSFFNISGVEATYMDPQQRIFLEESWKALEDSGYAGTGTEERLCGVYVGYNIVDYQQLLGDNPPPQAMWGNAGSVIPARIAYYLNLQGPAVAVDTACSSSLVAVHLACQGLWAGETDMALAGGVFVQSTPGFYIAANRAGMLSCSGCCHAFDRRADGFVPGEGAGVVVLKRINEAVADGDHIYGVIRGSGINQDGTTNGITAPSANSQERLERRVYDTFKIDPERIQMVEAHGTGTQLGDPIEYQALTRAFRNYTEKKEYCAIGSIKTNIGHTAAAAGIAGLIKILLSLQHRQIPPSLHFQAGNPKIRFKGSPFYVNTRLIDWDADRDSKRLAAISSFGFSGTNAHMVIEEAPREERRHRQRPGYLIVLSAHTSEQLQQQARQLAEYCEHEPPVDCGNLSYTLLLGRKHFNHRLACVARNGNELAALLKKWLKNNKVLQIYVSELNETAHREHAALKRYGDQCLRNCSGTEDDGEYLEHLSAVAELYIQGYALDFKRLFSNDAYSRISLPTYPLAGERYWVPEPGSDAEGASRISSKSVAAPSSQEPYELMTFTEEWREQALPDAAPAQIKTVICFVSSPESRELVLKTMQSLDGRTKIIFIAQNTADQEKSSPYLYYAAIDDRYAYEQAFVRIGKEHGQVDAMLCLSALENPDYIRDNTHIVNILQAMATAGLKVERFLLGAEFQDGLERCYLESWIGFERSLGILLPHMQVALLFQAASEGKQDKKIEAWLQRCWTEIRTEKVVSACYQGGKRHVRKVRPIKLQPGGTPIKQGGTYLITGGCGGLGFLFAEFLAGKYHANLLLIGRSPMNKEKESKIKALENMGSLVVYMQSDISDATGMYNGLKQAKKRLKEINGVIHAAGVHEKQSIFEKDMASFQRALDPKIRGTLVLDELLQSEPLDFVCYFSSSAAILGDMGACDYAIGNRFLMAYAHFRNKARQKGRKTGKAIVINWPLWREGGMRPANDQSAMYLKTSGQRFLESQEGLNIFERILAQDGEQYLVLAGQPGRVKRFLGVGQGATPSALTASSTCTAGKPLEMGALDLEQRIESDFKKNIGEVLNISQDKLDTKANLADFGFDSISLTHFAKVLSTQYAIEVTPALFFGHSTVENLVQYFIKEYPEKMHGFYQKDPEAPAASQKVKAVKPATSQRVSKRSGFSVSSAMSSVAEPIAVIGMSGRFPNARNVEEMWHILAKGESVIQDFPVERFSDQRPIKTNYKCGYIPGVSEFDPLFFEISPREAMSMDPRQRLLLQESWKALEDAGYGAARIKTGKIGVFVGAEEGEYGKLIKKKGSITSCHTAMLAARLAYFLNLDGPVMTFNTTCSSGLVAAHQACLSLRNNECDTAVAAGISLLLTSEIFD